MTTRIRLVIAAVLVDLWSLPGAAQAPALIDLGTLGPEPGGSEAVAINAAGQVVGLSSTAVIGERHAFLWDVVNGMRDLGTLGGSISEAIAINPAGKVAGWSTTASGSRHAFLWDPVNGMQDLGILPGGLDESQAVAMNAAGQVAGRARAANNLFHAFRWDAANGMQDLGTLGGDSSRAIAINALGHVVGSARTASGEDHAFLWDPANGMRDLGTLGGTRSRADAINDLGQVVGFAAYAGTDIHAVLWDPVNGMVDLGTLGGEESWAVAINSSGQVAGVAEWSDALDNRQNPFLWSPSLGMQAVGSEADRLSVVAMNSSGRVVGNMGNVPLEETVAFLAEPGMPNQFLGTFGGLHSAAFAINDLGQVVGWAETVAGIRRAFVTRLPGINPPGAPRFLRGDCNSDGEVTGVVSDAIFLLTFNFLGGQRPDCLAACDANGDGEVTGVVTDAINILTHNFLGGPPPVEPFPDCGPGALPDDERLGCAAPPASCAGG